MNQPITVTSHNNQIVATEPADMAIYTVNRAVGDHINQQIGTATFTFGDLVSRAHNSNKFVGITARCGYGRHAFRTRTKFTISQVGDSIVYTYPSKFLAKINELVEVKAAGDRRRAEAQRQTTDTHHQVMDYVKSNGWDVDTIGYGKGICDHDVKVVGRGRVKIDISMTPEQAKRVLDIIYKENQ